MKNLNLTDGDADEDGDVENEDLLLWADQFGPVATMNVYGSLYPSPYPNQSTGTTSLRCDLIRYSTDRLNPEVEET